MKRVNIFMGIIACLLMLMITSCNQDNIGAEYSSEENESVTFLAKTSDILAAPTETNVLYKIARANVNGRLELPIVADCDTDVFTIPSTVVFEDGKGTADISIPLDKTVLGVTYPVSLSFDSVKSSPFGYFKTTLNITKDYNWSSAGVAEMSSGWAGTTEDVKIEYAEGSNPSRYRLVSPYYELEPDYCKNPGYHLVFELDGQHNALNFLDQQKIGELYSDTYDIYIFSSANGDTFTNQGNVFTILGSFYVDIGGWGQVPEVFIWKQGYPGE
jgi:hypothetical protein